MLIFPGALSALLLASLLATTPVRAGEVCDFECLLAASLAEHPLVMAKRSEQAAALADKRGAQWARYPTPSIEASASSGGGDPGGLLRLDQPLWTGGRISAGIKAADRRFDAAGSALDEVRQNMAVQVINAYVEALRHFERERHARAGVLEHEKLLAMIQRRVDQDVSSRTDQRLAESRLLQVRNEEFLATQELRNMLSHLEQLSGQPVSELYWPLVDEGALPVALEKAQGLALDISPALQRLHHEEEAAEADVASRRSAYFPSLLLRLEHQSGGGAGDDSRGMVVLSAQPGAGFSAASGVEAARARRQALRQARIATEREIRERVALNWNELQAARLRLEAAESSSTISSEVFDSYARQYVIGRKSWIDVLNAVRETMNARFTLADAQAQITAAALRLLVQTGTLEINEQ